MEQVRLLTVCTGNICRSPLAELMLSAGLGDIPEFVVASAGTMARDGDVMPEQAQALAVGFGVDPTTHKARYLTERIVSESDVVFAMSREHRSAVVSLVPSKLQKTFTIREFARLSSTLSDERIREAAASDALNERISAVLRLVFAQKGVAGPVGDPGLDDVVDPYRRSDETYERSGAQLAPAAFEVVRVLRLAARPVPATTG
ncbi:low molecular weight phosphatase family protein [Herbiconiux sp.]|uniref:arsenate reductase/protein-tyrosine-phosphatase family protein n=1 Tax=Herbiconiux sp. TaxID=1871186 RepID=UPI0025BBA1B7|nr:low molecular weight phosphatase family protein [Herbiconiux sp.]